MFLVALPDIGLVMVRASWLNVLFAAELNRRVKTAGLGDKVKSNSCHPGLAATNLQLTTQQGGRHEGRCWLPKKVVALVVLFWFQQPYLTGAKEGPNRQTSGLSWLWFH